MAEQLVRNMKTHAVGRHLFDLPGDFTMDGGSVVLTYGLTTDFKTLEVEVQSFAGTPESYLAFWKTRHLELQTDTHDKLPNTSMLREVIHLSPTAVLLTRFENSLTLDVFRTDLISVVGTVLLTAHMKSYEGDPTPAKTQLMRLASQLNSPDNPVVGKGFRIGELLIAADHDQEYGDAFFRSKAAPGVLVSVSVNAIAPDPDPSLLGRLNAAAASAQARAFGIKETIVRKGQISLAGMQGEELLTKAQENGRLVMHSWAESKRPVPGFATPLLNVEMGTEPFEPEEKKKPAPWTELETVSVWDAIVKSVRPRPGAV